MEYRMFSAYRREDIKTPELYSKWLQSLKGGDRVILQSFEPASDSVFDLPFERWLFQSAKVVSLGEKGTIATLGDHQTKPIDLTTGMATYWNSQTSCGKVFPSRLVPYHDELVGKNDDSVFSDRPVYEPHYINKVRYVFLVPRGPVAAWNRNRLMQIFPHSYCIDCIEGVLVHCFSDWDESIESELIDKEGLHGVKLLYIKEVKD